MTMRAMFRPAFAAILLAGLGAPALAAPVKLSVETNYRLGYDMNPFLLGGDNVSSGYIETSIAPKLTKKTEKGEVSVGGHYGRTAYLRRYGRSDYYGGDASVQQRVTPKLAVFGALRYSSDVVGENDNVVTGSGAPIDNTDVNLIGSGLRSNLYSASGGFQYQATPRDTISVDGGYTKTTYSDGPGGVDSDSKGGRVALQHAVNSRTKIGVSGSVYKIGYDQPGLSTLIMEPRVTFSTQLSATWEFDASLGVSFSDLSLPATIGPDQRSKGVSGSVNLCHKGSRDDFCFYGDRNVSASGFGGSVERTQFGFSYDRRLSERLGFAAGGSYSRSKTQANVLGFGAREYVSAHAGFDYKLSRVITIGTEGRYRDAFGQGFPIKSDLGGEIYATVALPGPK